MRIVVFGATGNVGTSLLAALERDRRVTSVLGVARRLPGRGDGKVEWARADIAVDDLAPLLRGADCVVHLAWSIQPSRELSKLRRTNVDGSARVFRAVGEAGVPALVYASSVGAYSAGPKDRFVDESWPTDGIPTSFYSRHKAEVERLLDRFEQEHPSVRTVRLRPGLIFKRESAEEQRRLFAGPFVPSALVRRRLIPFVPDVPGLRFQAVHSYDIGDAYRLAATTDARGAFNVAAEPVVDPDALAHLLGARKVPVSAGVVRGAAALSWKLRLQPSPPGWIDLALQSPLLDSSRARGELGWSPRFTSLQALEDVLRGLRDRAGADTPTLEPSDSRVDEVVGSRVGGEE
jgi:nucleoside-diphosphate-sugar epimerase